MCMHGEGKGREKGEGRGRNGEGEGGRGKETGRGGYVSLRAFLISRLTYAWGCVRGYMRGHVLTPTYVVLCYCTYATLCMLCFYVLAIILCYLCYAVMLCCYPCYVSCAIL